MLQICRGPRLQATFQTLTRQSGDWSEWICCLAELQPLYVQQQIRAETTARFALKTEGSMDSDLPMKAKMQEVH